MYRRNDLERMALSGLLVLGATACDGTGPGGQGGVTLSIGTPATAGLNAAPETITVGADVLVFTKVELVLKKIELERVDADDCLGIDDCEELEVGPVVVDLPLGAGPARTFNVNIDAGVFDEVEFEIHKPEDSDLDDAGLLAGRPDLNHVSIRVEGTFNGTPFVWTTDLDVEQELDLVPPLTVAGGTPAGLTMIVDIGTWFRNSSGTGLIDPNSALKGQPNEGIVKENVKLSFHAECDD